jgi:hypothetical protein
MAANPLPLITVEEFRELPEPIGDYDCELHHGKLLPVTRPKRTTVYGAWVPGVLGCRSR